ncbi:182 kDa tankyrase-1-binding protein [Discoglossus pictus]
MSSQSPDDLSLHAVQDLKKAGPPRLKPLLKPKPAVLPRPKESHPPSGSHGFSIKDAPDNCLSSPPPEIPSALKISQLTGPQPYGTRRPSLKRWVSGGGGELNQGSSPLSPIEKPVFELPSKVTSHPVSAFPRPFQSGAQRKGLGPLLLTSRGWGEQRWQQGRDTPESDTASKTLRSSIESKDTAPEIISLEEKPVVDTPNSYKGVASFTSPILEREAPLSAKEVPEVLSEDVKFASSDVKSHNTEKTLKESTQFNKYRINAEEPYCETEKSIDIPEIASEKHSSGTETIVSEGHGQVSSICTEYDNSHERKVKPPEFERYQLVGITTPSHDNDQMVNIASLKHDNHDLRTASSKPGISKQSCITSFEIEEKQDVSVQPLEFKDNSDVSYLSDEKDVSQYMSAQPEFQPDNSENDCKPEESGLTNSELLPDKPSYVNGGNTDHLPEDKCKDPEQLLDNKDMVSEQNSQKRDLLPVPPPRGIKVAPKDHLQDGVVPQLPPVGGDLVVLQHPEDRSINLKSREQQPHVDNEIHQPYRKHLQEKDVDPKQYKKDLEVATEYSVVSSVFSELPEDNINMGAKQGPHDMCMASDPPDNLQQKDRYEQNREEINLVPAEPQREKHIDNQNLSPQTEGLWRMHDSTPILLENLNKKDDDYLQQEQGRSDLNLSESFEYYTGNSIHSGKLTMTAEGLLSEDQFGKKLTVQEQTEVEICGAESFPSDNYNDQERTFGEIVSFSLDHKSTNAENAEPLSKAEDEESERLVTVCYPRQPSPTTEDKQEMQIPHVENISTKEVISEAKGADHQMNDVAKSKQTEYNVQEAHSLTVEYGENKNVAWRTETSSDCTGKGHEYYLERQTGDYTERQPEISEEDRQEYYTEGKPASYVEERFASAMDRRYIDDNQAEKETTIDTRRQPEQHQDRQSDDHLERQFEGYMDQKYRDDTEKLPVEKADIQYEDNIDKQREADAEKQLEYAVIQSVDYSKRQPIDYVEKQSVDYVVIQSVDATEKHEVYLETQQEEPQDKKFYEYPEQQHDIYTNRLLVDHSDKQYEDDTQPDHHTDEKCEDYRQKQYDDYHESKPEEPKDIQHEVYTEKLPVEHTKHEDDKEKEPEVYIETQQEEHRDREYEDYTEHHHQVYTSRSHEDLVDSQQTSNTNRQAAPPSEMQTEGYYELPEKKEDAQAQICPVPQLRLDGIGTTSHPSDTLHESLNENMPEPCKRTSANVDEIDTTDIKSGQPEDISTKSETSQHRHSQTEEKEILPSEEAQHTGEAEDGDVQSEESKTKDTEKEETKAETDFAFLEGTEVLDNTSLRSRASLGKKRYHRTPPLQTCTSQEDTDTEYWMFRDSTEPRPERVSEDEEQEETSPHTVSDSSPSSEVTSPGKSHSKKGGIFSAITPSLLKGRLKTRSKYSVEEGTKGLSDESKVSPKSPEKDKQDSHSHNWLHALKRKKKAPPK